VLKFNFIFVEARLIPKNWSVSGIEAYWAEWPWLMLKNSRPHLEGQGFYASERIPLELLLVKLVECGA